LKEVGDNVNAASIQKVADGESKKVEAAMKDFDTAKPASYKEDDEVVYLLKDKKKEEWNKLTPEQKAKPKEKPASDIVGVHKIVKIEGDKYTIEDKDGNPTINKTSAEIISKFGETEKVEGEKAEGQEDLVKTLGDIKTKNPESIKKLNNIAKLYQDPEANKDKIAEIEKQLGEEIK
jgi:hypothetical protein